MNKFKLLNPELRELIGDDLIGEIGKTIQKYRISITSIAGKTQKAIFQPEGQPLVIFVNDGSAVGINCVSIEVPLNMDAAKNLTGRLDQSEWEFIHPLHGIEYFPCYRIDYFHSKGKSIEAQFMRHNELIDAGLVDAVVAIFYPNIDEQSLVEIYAGERFNAKGQ